MSDEESLLEIESDLSQAHCFPHGIGSEARELTLDFMLVALMGFDRENLIFGGNIRAASIHSFHGQVYSPVCYE